MRIHTEDERILHATCVDMTSDEIRAMGNIVRNAADLMYDTNGCGIAATQVGLDKRFCVIDVWWDPEDDEKPRKPMFLFNPHIVSHSESTESEVEGCLSVVGVVVAVERPTDVVVEYVDENGDGQTLSANGRLARCLQHEIDHLDGMTIVDHLRGMDKVQAILFLEDAKKKGLAPGDKAIYKVG